MYKVNLLLNFLIVIGLTLVDYIIPNSNIELFYIPVILLLPKIRSLIFKQKIKTNTLNELLELFVNVYLLLITSRCLFDTSINFNDFEVLAHPYIVIRLIVITCLLLFMNLILYKNKLSKEIKLTIVSDIMFGYISLFFAIAYLYFSVKCQQVMSPVMAFVLSLVLILMIFNLIKRIKEEEDTVFITLLIAILGCILGNGIFVFVFLRFGYLKYYKNKKLFY